LRFFFSLTLKSNPDKLSGAVPSMEARAHVATNALAVGRTHCDSGKLFDRPAESLLARVIRELNNFLVLSHYFSFLSNLYPLQVYVSSPEAAQNANVTGGPPPNAAMQGNFQVCKELEWSKIAEGER
jgi:hypothetical protein